MDSSWLVKLFFAAGLEACFRLSPLELILDDARMRAWHAAKDSVLADYPDRRHRASVDGFVIQPCGFGAGVLLICLLQM